MKNTPCVAIINSVSELIDMIKELLEEEGYRAITALISDIKKVELDIHSFMKEFDPQVIIYDIPPPYDLNWHFFKLLEDSPSMNNCAFVVTTTNKKALDSQVGNTPTMELIGKPFDLSELMGSVKRAMKKKPRI